MLTSIGTIVAPTSGYTMEKTPTLNCCTHSTVMTIQERLLAPETHCLCIFMWAVAFRFPVSESSTTPLKVRLIDDDVR